MLKKIEKAKAKIKQTIQSHPTWTGFSGGKDSGSLQSLSLVAMRELVEAGEKVFPMVVGHADTEVENPSIATHAREELAKIQVYAEKHNLPVSVMIGRPNLSSSWAVRTIGQGKIPAYPGGKQDCTDEYKIKPQAALRKLIRKSLSDQTDRAPVTMTGVRFEESAERAAKMRARGDNAEDIIKHTKTGELSLAPIAEWTEDDVWEYVALAGQGIAFENYSDFEELKSIYAAATPSSCPVMGDMELSENKKQRGGCGARFGCWSCAVIGQDKSMISLIKNEPERYGYMKHLNGIQRWLAAIRYDYENRCWLPRTIKHGWARVQPDTLGASQIESLFKFVVTADVVEAIEAEKLGIEPRFHTIDLKKLIAIDAEWSKLGHFPPFHAVKLYKDIVEKGERHFAPDIKPFPRVEQPEARYVYIGEDWADPSSPTGHLVNVDQHRYVSGIDSMAELFVDAEGCEMEYQTGKTFDVDEEGAELFMTLESDRMIGKFCNWGVEADWQRDITEGYKYYVRMGIIRVSKAHIGTTKEILRRTYYREAIGAAGPSGDYRNMLALSVSKKERDAHVAELLAEKEAEKEAETAFRAWLKTSPGQTYTRIRELMEVEEQAKNAFEVVIQSDAYIGYAEQKGYSPVFDGVNYAEYRSVAIKEVRKLERRYANDDTAMALIGTVRNKLFQQALNVIAGQGGDHKPSRWFTLSFVTNALEGVQRENVVDQLRQAWSFELKQIHQEDQLSLFDQAA